MSLKKSIFALLAVTACLSHSAVYAYAPVQDVAQAQPNAATASQADSSSAAAPANQSATSSAAGQSFAQNTAPPATQKTTDNTQPPLNADPTDNNPLISSPTLMGDSTDSSLPMSQRVARLEQQMQNMVHANMPDQLTDLQQQVAQLSGKLAVQQHDITLLNKQLNNFYQDLSSQIKQVKNMASGNDDASANTLPASPAPVTTPEPSAPTHQQHKAKMNSVSLDASSQYQLALTKLMHKQYSDSADLFKTYLKKNPQGHFVMNAHYWLGEIYLHQQKLSTATKEFNVVIHKFPHSNKVADANVKLAIIHASQGALPQARRELMTVQKRYPGTTAAQLASIQLQQLGNQH